MKICITGGAGMIGSSLTKFLLNNKNDVIIIDNLWRGKLENLLFDGDYIIDLNKSFFEIDLSNELNISKVSEIISDVDVVIHLADIVAGIGYVFNKQYEIFRKNITINTNLFQAVHDSNIKKLIYVGTACSFPLELQNGLKAELKDEDLFPANPESAYGWSKLIGQLELKYLREIAKFEINTLILHNVYGPNCEYDSERTQVIPSLINRILDLKEGDTLTVWGSGEQGRAFIHVNDVIDAIYKTLLGSNLPEYMQIGPNYCTSIKDLVANLITISGKNLNICYDKSKPEGDKGRFANYSIAKDRIGWEPKIELKDGLKETYFWIKSQKNK